MQKRIIALYKAPFSMDFMNIYLFDANKEMVADFKGDNDTFRARGFGRMKYMENGEALHDATEAFLHDLVKNVNTNPAECVKILNNAWKE